MSDGRRVVLIADDDEFFRMAISTVLSKRLNMDRVIETASLDEALEVLGEEREITVALFDLSMPGMESPASLGAVRELFPDITVVVVSASQRRKDILVALEAGVHGYVPKGLGVDELATALQYVLAGNIYVPPSLAEIERPAGHYPAEQATRAPDTEGRNGLSNLTPRQRDVLDLLVQGRSNKEIARKLDLGESTVKIHLAALFRSLGVRNRAGAAAEGAKLLGRSRMQDFRS